MERHCGTTTLVDRRLKIANVFRLPLFSKYGRDGLFVDTALSGSCSAAQDSSCLLRLCNVRLESLIANPLVRPHQLSALAAYLHAPEVACALLAGDLNAIEPFDRTLHSENELEDAYLTLGGREDSDEGYTWGYQVPAVVREKFGCSRVDKILFRGDVRANAFERIGVGVVVAEDKREGRRERKRGLVITTASWVTLSLAKAGVHKWMAVLGVCRSQCCLDYEGPAVRYDLDSIIQQPSKDLQQLGTANVRQAIDDSKEVTSIMGYFS